MIPDDKLVALAAAHPRGNERRALRPLRDALQSPVSYAALDVAKRDEIVRWAEVRRRIRLEHSVDGDPRNLADPLLPEARLRALVVEGEIAAAAVAADGAALAERALSDGIPVVVAEIRARRAAAAE